jgi:WD40 repeat protein
MPGIKGRIDHLDINLKEKIVYIAALGNNSLEIVDITKGKILHSITGLNEPQGVAYISQEQEIFVANGGNGDCYFYNAHSFEKTATIHLSSDADDVRYDSIDGKIYVGYGEGGIAIIDAKQHKQIGNIKLSAHPEGFQLDKKMNKIFINVPDAHQIAVGDLSSFELISTWNTGELRSNFPLAIDTLNHVIFIGYRRPAKLVSLDGVSGNTLAIGDLVNDTDDIFFDERENKIYASGGGGFITIYQWEKPEIKEIAKIYTRDGARTSLLVPALKLFILAARANNNNNAELQVYEIRSMD